MRKFFRYFFLTIVAILVLFTGFALISGKTYLFKAVWYNFADIDDYKIFTNDTVATGTAQPWELSADYNKQEPPAELMDLLTDLKTVALLRVENGQIVYEKYWDGYGDNSFSNSFSMAKSVTSLLIGAAIKEGKIGSVDDKVSQYLDGFTDGYAAELTIKDLLTMSSGSNWSESYMNPLSVTTEAYYGSHLEKTMSSLKFKKKPGTYHEYKSGDTQWLGMLLEKATGKSLSAYASEKLWKPLGAEHPALWSTDQENGVTKAYCCFNTNARDFARLGQLMLDSGRWKGETIIDSAYFAQSITPCMIPDETGQPANYYGYQWWVYPGETQIFYARGILGQYIIVIPERNTIIVRLGHSRSKTKENGAPLEVGELVRWGSPSSELR